MVKKHMIGLFLNVGTPTVPRWVRIKKATALTISLNPETEEFDYIADESKTTELKDYKPSIDQPLTMYENEPDYQFIFDKFYELKTGNDAHSEVLVVYMQTAVGERQYKAWKSDCIIVVNDLDGVGSVINFNIQFGGTTKKGTATISGVAPDVVPVYSDDTETGFSYTVTVQNASGDVKGATVEIGGIQAVTNADGEAVFTLINGKTYTIGAYKDDETASEVITASSSSTTKTITIE